MKVIKIFFISSLMFLVFCKNKNESNDPETKRKIELIEKIKERTEQDLKKYGIKKILLSNNGSWGFNFVMDVEFKEDGTGYTILNGKKSDKFFYWKVENNKLYINPNKAINPFDENKFLPVILKPLKIPIYMRGIKILERYIYALKIESEDKRLELRITLYSPKKIVD